MAAIAYYTGSSDPYLTTEGYDRWHYYPPPYLMGGTWYYAWPWLWMDGNNDPAYQFAQWETFLQARLPVPSEMEIDLNGHYDPDARTGALGIRIHNQGPETKTGTLQCVLTESGLYYQAPNGLDWHHHVMRDMIPTEVGTEVTIPPGESALVTHEFQIDPAWDHTTCEIVCFVQDEVMQPDSSFAVWQGAKVMVPDLPGPAAISPRPALAAGGTLHPCLPNPGRQETEISFDLPAAADVRLSVFDTAGRQVITLLEGAQPAGPHTVVWRGVDAAGGHVPSGVYYLRLEAGATLQTRQVLIAR